MGGNQRECTSGECVITVPPLVVRQRELIWPKANQYPSDGEHAQSATRDVHRRDRAWCQ